MSVELKIKHLNFHQERTAQRLKTLQQQRLSFGLITFFLFILSQIAKGYYFEFIALLITFPIFLYFFSKSRKIEKHHDQLSNRKQFYINQLDFKNGNFTTNLLPEEMANPDLARDLDLNVLFSHIDHCFSKQGSWLLNQWLCQIFNSSSLQERQTHLLELEKQPGLLRKIQSDPLKQEIDFLRIENEVSRSFFEEDIKWKWIVPGAWMALILFLFFPVPEIFWKSTLLLYVGSVLSYIGKTKFLFSRLQDLFNDFDQLKNRIDLYEKLGSQLSFTEQLKAQTASKDVKKLSFYISLMSLRTNPILFYILNLVLPWDFLLSELIEKSRQRFNSHYKKWSQEIIYLEALGSLINLKLYQDTIWSNINTDQKDFVAVKDLSHPLLNQDSVVKNSFSPNDKSVIIITGSNMSGKSTFLRALGINLCLANIGAPVFASAMSFKPMKIVTCIRVSDSLRDGQSYFYAEVQRMKHILLTAQKTSVFFLIDEPLRGTNNKERLIGNQSYLKQILSSQAQGFICTHDLELTKLSNESEKIDNFHFSEQWENQDLHFDYKIKTGPSQSTNALRILEKEGLFTPSI